MSMRGLKVICDVVQDTQVMEGQNELEVVVYYL